MLKIIEALPLDECRIYLKFSDGSDGDVNLSELEGRGLFKAWDDLAFFQQAKIGSLGRSLEWSGRIELSADSLYLELTDLTAEQLFPKLEAEE